MATLIVTGRVGRDAEIRSLQDGTKVLSFSIADDIGYGEKKKTQWISAAMFDKSGKRAEALAPYVTKGSVVEVVGEPSVNSYEGKNGFKAELQVRVERVKLHGGKKSEDALVADRARATRGNDDMDSEIPF